MLPPNAQMNQLIMNAWMTQAISVVARLGVPQALADGPRPVADIATEVGAHAPTLNRVLRALSETGLFTVQGDRYALTALGRTLVPGTPGSLASAAVMIGSDWQVAIRGGLYESVRTGRPATRAIWGASLFEYLEKHPEDDTVFNAAMVEVSATATAAAAERYDFGRFSTLVDIGGGNGHLLTAILSTYPGLHGVLFDQPGIAASTEHNLAQLSIADRCRCAGGDFFESIPADGDGYLISNVLHDWSDEQVVRILRNCAAAMHPQATLLISEWVLREGRGPDPVSTALDLQMLLVTDGGKERTQSEFAELLDRAGLTLTDTIRDDNPSLPTLLEAKPRP